MIAFALLWCGFEPLHGQVLQGGINAPDTVQQKLQLPVGGPVKSSIDKAISYRCDDSLFYDFPNSMIYLYGNATIDYGDMKLKAAYIAIDLKKQEIFASGLPDSMGRYANLPVLTDDGEEYRGDSMRYNSKTKRGKVYGLKLQEGESLVSLKQVFKNDDGSFLGQHGTMTTCNAPHPHFYINASKLKVIPDKKIIFGPSNLVVEDVPTPGFLPFGLFPTKKGQRSGLIIPATAFSRQRGYGFQNVGFYWGKSEYFDAAFTGDIYLNGNWGLRVASNYARRYHYNGNLVLGYSRFTQGENYNNTRSTTPSMNITWRHTIDQRAHPGFSFGANVNFQTGNYNQWNSTSIGRIVQNRYNSSINIGKSLFRNKANLTAALNHDQNNIDSTVNFTLPEMALTVQRINPFMRRNRTGETRWYENISVNYTGQFRNELRTKESRINTLEKLGNELGNVSNGVRHSITLAANVKFWKKYFNLVPSMNYDEWWYFRQVRQQLDTQSNNVLRDTIRGFSRPSQYRMGVSLTTNIYGTFRKFRFGRVQGLRHTLQPAIGFSYVPGGNSSYFGRYITDTASRREQSYSYFATGVVGGPGQSKELAIMNYSISNILQMKVLKKNDSLGRSGMVNLVDAFNISGNYNVLADSLNLSPVQINLGKSLPRGLNINCGLQLDPYTVVSGANGAAVRVNRFAARGFGADDPTLMRIVSYNVNTGFSLSAEDLKKKNKKESETKADPNEKASLAAEMARRPENFYRFEIPWSFSMNYGLRYDRMNFRNVYTNIVNLSGNVNITPEWKVGFSSGYDFINKRVSTSSIDITRNLHCWELSFRWIPNGVVSAWYFTLRPKGGILSDLKINKNSYWWD